MTNWQKTSFWTYTSFPVVPPISQTKTSAQFTALIELPLPGAVTNTVF